MLVNLRGKLKPTAVMLGVVTAVLNLLATVLVQVHWDLTFRFRPVEPWVPIASDILGFPLQTLLIDPLTHRTGILTVGGRMVDVFQWAILLNAVLWGVIVAAIYRVAIALRRPRMDTTT